MSKEIVILTDDGVIGTEMIGFEGKTCFKAAAKVAKELETLGVVSSVNDIQIRNDVDRSAVVETKKFSQVIERG